MFNYRNEIVRRRHNSDGSTTYWVVDIREGCTIRNKRVIHDRYIKIHSLGTATSAEVVKRMYAQGKRWIATSSETFSSRWIFGRRKRNLQPIKRPVVCNIGSSPALANSLSKLKISSIRSSNDCFVLPSYSYLTNRLNRS